MKRFLLTIALVSLLSASALAGDLPTSGGPSPSPGDLPTSGNPSPAAMVTASPGNLPTSGFAERVSDTALSTLLSVLGLVGI